MAGHVNLVLIFISIVPNCSPATIFNKKTVDKYGLISKLRMEKMSSVFECAAVCINEKLSFQCDGFAFDNKQKVCQFFNAWKIIDQTPFHGLPEDVYLKAGLSIVTYEIKIHSASVFDKSDCSILTSCKSDDYGAKWILQNVKSCRDFHKNVWFGKKKTNEQFIIFDMGSERKIKEIQILNNFDMSTTFSKWGSKDYKIEVTSQDTPVDFEILLEGTFDDYASKQSSCQVPMLIIDLQESAVIRFLKFTAKTYFGDGAALQYFKID